MSVCDNCGVPTNIQDGAVLTTREVVMSPGYWEYSYRNHGTQEGELTLLVMTRAREQTGWLFCKRCSPMCHYNHDKASKAAANGADRRDGGPIEPGEAAMVAGAAWYKVHGRWPSGIQFPGGQPGAGQVELFVNNIYKQAQSSR